MGINMRVSNSAAYVSVETRTAKKVGQITAICPAQATAERHAADVRLIVFILQEEFSSSNHVGTKLLVRELLGLQVG
jgi:hypothetical protein